MGRVLQKKKNRSSLPKVKQKPKSKHVNIKSNPIVAANWSQNLTLSQNYHRLGLTSKLNSRAGGTEPQPQPSTTSTAPTQANRDPLAIASSRAPKTLTPTTAKITRDPKTGAILRVEHSLSGRNAKPNPLDDPMNEISDDGDDGGNNNTNGYVRNQRKGGNEGIVLQLERAAAQGGKKSRPRVQSQGEREWIERLVVKWGDDYRAMNRDRRLNPQQQSEGDLRKRVRKWKEGKGGGGDIAKND